MQLLAIAALLFVIAVAHAYVGRKVDNNIGRNMGNSYMKNHWGIEDDNNRD